MAHEIGGRRGRAGWFRGNDLPAAIKRAARSPLQGTDFACVKRGISRTKLRSGESMPAIPFQGAADSDSSVARVLISHRRPGT